MNYYGTEETSFLSHHGILGQKWGVRRYQTFDGKLTPAGKKRYQNAIKEREDRINTEWNAAADKVDKRINELVNSNKEYKNLLKGWTGDGGEFCAEILRRSGDKKLSELDTQASDTWRKIHQDFDTKVGDIKRNPENIKRKYRAEIDKENKAIDKRDKEYMDLQLEKHGWKRDEDFDKFLSDHDAAHKGTFEMTTKLKDGRSVHLLSDYDSKGETAKDFTQRNKDALSTYCKNEKSIKSQIANELYDAYGKNWNGYGNRSISKNEFVKKLTPDSFGVSDRKGLPTQVVMTDKSGLFGGHVITFEMDEKGKVYYVGLEG